MYLKQPHAHLMQRNIESNGRATCMKNRRKETKINFRNNVFDLNLPFDRRKTTIAGLLLVITIAHSYDFIGNHLHCALVWLLQLNSLWEMFGWQNNVDKVDRSLQASERSNSNYKVEIQKLKLEAAKVVNLETSVKQAESTITRLKHELAEQQKRHEFQLRQELKAEARRIQNLNADREIALGKEVDKLEIAKSKLTKEIKERKLVERDKSTALLRKKIDAIEIPDGSCPICFEKYSEEILLVCFARCGHMLCQSCANKIAAEHKACHKCRVKVPKKNGIQRLFY